MHKSGFINIIGRPNVGKSTLMNALVGERMSIITNKPQTTRHRIIGILSGEDFQLVFSDTPGIINNPNYKMQEAMNSFVHGSFEDADVFVFVTEPKEEYAKDDNFLQKIGKVEIPVLLVLNKIDTLTKEEAKNWKEKWEALLPNAEIRMISALNKKGTDILMKRIIKHCPQGPAYYPKDQLTDRPERFFVSEIIREKILLCYREEIPYSCEVIVESFKEGTTREDKPIVRISAMIYVSRKSQKVIMLGKEGKAIKKMATMARKSIEDWLQTKVFLELRVKVRDNWRDDEKFLKGFGYKS